MVVIVYYWSRQNADQIVSFYFGITFKAVYFPWALVAMNVLMGGSPIPYVSPSTHRHSSDLS